MSERLIKVQVKATCTRAEYARLVTHGIRLPDEAPSKGRFISVAISEILAQESVHYDLGPDTWTVRGHTFLQLPSPVRDDDISYSSHCALVLSDRVIITEESFGEIERMMIDAINRGGRY